MNKGAPCVACGKPVPKFAEVGVGSGVVHRDCYKCATCAGQLGLALVDNVCLDIASIIVSRAHVFAEVAIEFLIP